MSHCWTSIRPGGSSRRVALSHYCKLQPLTCVRRCKAGVALTIPPATQHQRDPALPGTEESTGTHKDNFNLPARLSLSAGLT
ncbi:hypothetical protein E2C01_078309 [Portunus trituberculatus]|uniref:Uncharacterized protein n=1 Tax=Portunus trituberculatus TaxID=210409 RepID=A0A5B7IPV8_PORTR|nr:hypothetical protein [Portunus trituberculatus]